MWFLTYLDNILKPYIISFANNFLNKDNILKHSKHLLHCMLMTVCCRPGTFFYTSQLMSYKCHLPMSWSGVAAAKSLPEDLRKARTQRFLLLFLKTGTVAGANFSLLMRSWVSGLEHMPSILSKPLSSVWARITFGWSATATLAPDTGTPVTLRISPRNVCPSQTQWLHSLFGCPTGHTSWHTATICTNIKHGKI